MNTVKVYLYSTLGCHLCEGAKAVLWPLLSHYQLSMQEVDIADSDELVEFYGTRIPVLHVETASEVVCELNWPFTAQQVDACFSALVEPAAFM